MIMYSVCPKTIPMILDCNLKKDYQIFIIFGMNIPKLAGYFLDTVYYARKQLLLSARLSHRNSVRPSVCSSHGWIRQKRSKLGSPNFYLWLPGRL